MMAYRPSTASHQMWAESQERLDRAITSLKHHFDPSKNFDLIAHLKRQIAFSIRIFGPGVRTKGVVDHIRKELTEIEKAPLDLEEWIDVVILALDGAWRTGASAEQIVAMLEAKQTKNEQRTWPDWRTVGQDQAIEHTRGDE